MKNEMERKLFSGNNSLLCMCYVLNKYKEEIFKKEIMIGDGTFNLQNEKK